MSLTHRQKRQIIFDSKLLVVVGDLLTDEYFHTYNNDSFFRNFFPNSKKLFKYLSHRRNNWVTKAVNKLPTLRTNKTTIWSQNVDGMYAPDGDAIFSEVYGNFRRYKFWLSSRLNYLGSNQFKKGCLSISRATNISQLFYRLGTMYRWRLPDIALPSQSIKLDQFDLTFACQEYDAVMLVGANVNEKWLDELLWSFTIARKPILMFMDYAFDLDDVIYWKSSVSTLSRFITA